MTLTDVCRKSMTRRKKSKCKILRQEQACHVFKLQEGDRCISTKDQEKLLYVIKVRAVNKLQGS